MLSCLLTYFSSIHLAISGLFSSLSTLFSAAKCMNCLFVPDPPTDPSPDPCQPMDQGRRGRREGRGRETIFSFLSYSLLLWERLLLFFFLSLHSACSSLGEALPLQERGAHSFLSRKRVDWQPLNCHCHPSQRSPQCNCEHSQRRYLKSSSHSLRRPSQGLMISSLHSLTQRNQQQGHPNRLHYYLH
jgi:hypothetical protein